MNFIYFTSLLGCLTVVSSVSTTSNGTVTNADNYCLQYTNVSACAGDFVCTWDYGKTGYRTAKCEGDDDVINQINDAACFGLSTVDCKSNLLCKENNNKCEGDEDYITIGANGVEYTNVIQPTNSTYKNMDNYCFLTYAELTSCQGNVLCKWNQGYGEYPARCESNDDAIEKQNYAKCVVYSPSDCSKYLNCDGDDDKCEGNDDIAVF